MKWPRTIIGMREQSLRQIDACFIEGLPLSFIACERKR